MKWHHLKDKPIMNKLIEHEKIILNYFSYSSKTNDFSEIELFLQENSFVNKWISDF